MSQAVGRVVVHCSSASLTHFHLDIFVLIIGLHKANSLQLVVQQFYLFTSVFKAKI